jgi:hypothetical protein
MNSKIFQDSVQLKENGEVATTKWVHLPRRSEGMFPKTKEAFNTWSVQLSNKSYSTDLLGRTTIYFAQKSRQSRKEF